MSVSGVVIDLKAVNNVILDSVESFSLEEIQKFDTINNKNSKIKKKEFINIINAFEDMIYQEIFKEVDDTQEFIINLVNNVSEFDAITILDSLKGNLVVDIEVKRGETLLEIEETKQKLSIQLKQKVNNHLNQMFVKENKLVIGYINNKFYKAFYFESGNSLEEFFSISELKKKLDSLQIRKLDLIVDRIINANNLDKINDIYTKLESGDFKLYDQCTKKVNEIKKHILENKKVIICLAKAGYGKTVLALKIFFDTRENPNYKLLVLNEKFYKSFNMKKYFVTKKAFYGTDALISNITSNDYVIIDETQRLTKEQLKVIVEKSKCVIFFGDTSQAFRSNDDFYKEEIFINEIEKLTYNYVRVKIRKPNRYDTSSDKAIRYMTTHINSTDEIEKLDKFDIKIFNNQKLFLKSYLENNENKKIFTLFDFGVKNSLIVLKDDSEKLHVFDLANRDDSTYAINSSDDIVGHSLHAVSFDVDHCYVILNDLTFNNRYDLPVPSCLNVEDEVSRIKYTNELNILFSRGKKSLTILIADLKSYLWFNKRKKDIFKK